MVLVGGIRRGVQGGTVGKGLARKRWRWGFSELALWKPQHSDIKANRYGQLSRQPGAMRLLLPEQHFSRLLHQPSGGGGMLLSQGPGQPGGLAWGETA